MYEPNLVDRFNGKKKDEIYVHVPYDNKVFYIPFSVFYTNRCKFQPDYLEVSANKCMKKFEKVSSSITSTHGMTIVNNPKLIVIDDESTQPFHGNQLIVEPFEKEDEKEQPPSRKRKSTFDGPRKRKVSSRLAEKITTPANNCTAIEYKESHGFECGICMIEPARCLWTRDTIGGLMDLPKKSTEDLLSHDLLICAPCRKHYICIGCLYRIITDRDNPPVSNKSAAVFCMCAGQKCDASYQVEWFRWILDSDEQDRLVRLYEKHRFPGFEIVKCPLLCRTPDYSRLCRPKSFLTNRLYERGRENPSLSLSIDSLELSLLERTISSVCGADCLVPCERVLEGGIGTVTVACTQNPDCGGSFCYHCKRGLTSFNPFCPKCILTDERENPESFNRYFYNPGLIGTTTTTVGGEQNNVSSLGVTPRQFKIDNPFSHLLKNKDLTIELMVRQIEEILSMERTTPRCSVCGVHLYKSVMCNTLCHCNVEKCYVCGKNSPIGGHLESTHWDSHGRHGCPRYDQDEYWKTLSSQFLCKEGHCYSAEGECTISSHQPGIHCMHRERKIWQVYSMLKSIPLDRQTIVLNRIKNSRASPDKDLLIRRVHDRLYN